MSFERRIECSVRSMNRGTNAPLEASWSSLPLLCSPPSLSLFSERRSYSKNVLIDDRSYSCCSFGTSALIKLSVLLYSRIFSTTRFPRIIKVAIGFTIAWLISFLFATFFQVWPFQCNWIACDPTTNYLVMHVCCSVTDIMLDISILCLLSLFVRNLQISRNKKY